MSEQVHIRVGETRHEKWEDYAETEYDSNMSKLIRSAVEKEISGGSNGNSASEDTQTVEANGRIDAVLNGVEDNGDALDAIQEQLTAMRDTLAQAGGVGDKAFSDVFGAVPTVEYAEGVESSNLLDRERGSTPSEIADEAGVSIEEAEVALAQMRRQYDDVKMYMSRDDTEPVYWREEEI